MQKEEKKKVIKKLIGATIFIPHLMNLKDILNLLQIKTKMKKKKM
jgi:hypothetical protein